MTIFWNILFFFSAFFTSSPFCFQFVFVFWEEEKRRWRVQLILCFFCVEIKNSKCCVCFFISLCFHFICLHVIVKLFIFKTCFCVLIGNTQTDGISLLGSAIGYEGFLSQFLEAKLNDFKNLVRFFIQNTIFSCSLLTLTQYTLSDLYRPHHQPLSNSAVTVFLLYLDPFLTCFIYHRYPIRVRAFWKWLVNQT